MVHQEVDRLPEKYRAPIVLCYLEGLTHDEAAARLSWPVGTVRSRLSRARDTLRSRLTRRGVTAPSTLGPLAAWLISDAAASTASAVRGPTGSSLHIRWRVPPLTSQSASPRLPARCRPPRSGWPKES